MLFALNRAVLVLDSSQVQGMGLLLSMGHTRTICLPCCHKRLLAAHVYRGSCDIGLHVDSAKSLPHKQLSGGHRSAMVACGERQSQSPCFVENRRLAV